MEVHETPSGGEDDTQMSTAEITETDEDRAELSTADINDLPDAAFAYIEAGGKKDSGGKTTPRSLRHYPVHDAAHTRNALARAAAAIKGGGDSAAIAKKAMPGIMAAAKKFGIDAKEQTSDPDEGQDGTQNENSPYGAGNSLGSGDGTGSRSKRTKKPRHRSGPAVGPEVRFRTNILEIRAASDDFDVIEVTGEPIVYDTPYPVRDMFGVFNETMRSGAAEDCLARGADVRFLFNHDGLPLARTSSGTLKLTDTPKALVATARLDTRQQFANDLAVAIERGDVSQMSVGFTVADDEWNPAEDERVINRLSDLLDVSAVTYPASPTTSIEVAHRMLLQAPVESRARIRKAWLALRELREGKVLSSANQKLITDALEALHVADDADITDIVRRLQDVDGALDKGQGALAQILGVEDPDGDAGDLEPTLMSPDDDGRVDRDGEDPDAEQRDDDEAVKAAEAAERKRKLELEAEYMRMKRRKAA